MQQALTTPLRGPDTPESARPSREPRGTRVSDVSPPGVSGLGPGCEYLVNIELGRGTPQKRVTGGRWRRIVLVDVLWPDMCLSPRARTAHRAAHVVSFCSVWCCGESSGYKRHEPQTSISL